MILCTWETCAGTSEPYFTAILSLADPSVHDAGHTNAQTLLIQARGEMLDPFMRLLRLVEVHLRLPVAAKHVLVPQTDTKIVREFQQPPRHVVVLRTDGVFAFFKSSASFLQESICLPESFRCHVG